MLKSSTAKLSIMVAIAAPLVFGMISGTAQAGKRYATPPPAVMSADLTAPWITQLRGGTTPGYKISGNRAASQKYRVKLARPAINSRIKAQQPRKKSSWLFASRTATAQRNQVRASPVHNPAGQFAAIYEPQTVSYATSQTPGTIVIDTGAKFLYLVMKDGKARRYGVGVARPGFEWRGTNKITRKAEWPDWRPPAAMIAREKKAGRILAPFVPGGIDNALGARAMYLGSTLYRIHGTAFPGTIGQRVSSGCIRLRNEDVMDLYERVGVGTKVIVS